jgi:hypothetical protein
MSNRGRDNVRMTEISPAIVIIRDIKCKQLDAILVALERRVASGSMRETSARLRRETLESLWEKGFFLSPLREER